MGHKNDETLELVREAIDQIKRGDITDALTTLERTAYPKFWHPGEARMAYGSVMAGNDNKEAAPAVSTTSEVA